MRRIFLFTILLLLLPATLCSQALRTNDANAQAGKSTGFGSGDIFNPFAKDTTKSEKVTAPKEIHQWHIDELMGTPIPVNADTLPHLYQNWHMTEGMNGEYNFLGNMGAPRQSRIFFNRPSDTQYNFLAPYDYFVVRPGELFFTDTKSPYTNLSYNESGDKVTGDDRFRAYFATNAGKKFGVGFLFDYLYGRGRYDNQSTAFMNFSLFSYYRSDKYNYHLLASRYHIKMAENGGITDDEYITNPEKTDGANSNFGTTDIPVHLDRTWNRNEVYTAYFSHNYNFGFYKKVRKDISGDSIANEVNRYMNERSAAQTDSTLTAGTNDSIATRQASAVSDDELEMRFIPVARITHTADLTTNRHEFLSYEPANNYYAHNYLPYDSIDRTDYWTLKNTVALSLREGFNKWAIADITAYVSYVYSNYRQPDTIGTREYRLRTDEHTLMIGGQIESTRNRYLKYKLRGETAVSGNDLGAFNIEGKGELNLRLLKQDSKLTLNAHIKNNRPSYYYRHYHSEHYWWDKNLDKEFRTRIEAGIALPRWKTSIKAGIENIKNYTYFANTPVANGNRYLSDITVKQESSNIQVLSATLKQDFGAGPLNLETEFTYQNSSNKSILPLPDFNAYANLYIKFRIAKVLNTELGADCRYFTSYYAPDYSAALGQFVQQNQNDKISIGNYPVVSVYANFLLKETRFYVMYYHVNEGTGNRNYFLAPHYPMSPKALWFGLSWNFYN
ncbi:MAG: putative porin [Bacteroidaceae bacterium]|nr:putative porin [Bacteroidaceae bacterium]